MTKEHAARQTRDARADADNVANAPQPCGELFVMRYDGSDVRQFTDNQWEDGTPAWQPTRPDSH